MKMLRASRAVMLAGPLLLAGVGALAPAAAHAVSTCTFGVEASTCLPDLVFDKVGDKTLKLIKVPDIGAGRIDFYVDAPVYIVSVDFGRPGLRHPSGLGTFEYVLTIDPAPENSSYFLEAGLAIDGPAAGGPVYSAMKSISGNSSLAPQLMTLNVDATTRQATDTFDELLKQIYVVDTYEAANLSINSFQNSFTQQEFTPPESGVPGPLPLFGAGAAFGFSRRLRSRMSAARRG